MKNQILLLTIVALLFVSCNDKAEDIPSIEYLRVYPNPATDNVYVGVLNQSSSEPSSLKIFDSKAEIIFEESEITSDQDFAIDLLGKPKGNYNVILQRGGTTYIQKLVKQ